MEKVILLLRKWFMPHRIFYVKFRSGNNEHFRMACIKDGRTRKDDFVVWLKAHMDKIGGDLIVEDFKIL